MPGLRLLQSGPGREGGAIRSTGTVASGPADRPMGVAGRDDHRETGQLELKAEQLPISCSLLLAVTERYASIAGEEDPALTMDPQELLDYLRAIEDFNTAPLAAVQAEADALDDPAHPGAQQTAILAWLHQADRQWRQNYPLEPELDAALRPLVPLLAHQALSDNAFLQPGTHPLHQLLDTLQSCGVGWQASLGRAAGGYLQQVEAIVASLREWFSAGEGDLAELCAEAAGMLQRERERSQCMTQRLVETEQGRLKAAFARQRAAGMINEHLARGPLPPAFTEFLTGPWFDSAQLVLLREGPESDHWEKLCAATSDLLDSMRMEGPAGENRRQLVFEIIARLPRELKRWLLSLQHQPVALNEAVGKIEAVHLAILRQEEIPLEKTEPIATGGDEYSDENPDVIKTLAAGQWFLIEQDGPRRLQLALKSDLARRLMFCNYAGQKALELGFSGFARLLADGRATPLAEGGSFSLSLALAAGIDSSEGLETLQRREARRGQHRGWEKTQHRLRDFDRAEWLRQGPADLARTGLSESEQEQINSYLRHRAQRMARAGHPTPTRERSVRLELGSWLGFHDGEEPVTAKLAALDRERGLYVFVDRAGNPLRELGRTELQELMDRGLIDLLQQRNHPTPREGDAANE